MKENFRMDKSTVTEYTITRQNYDTKAFINITRNKDKEKS